MPKKKKQQKQNKELEAKEPFNEKDAQIEESEEYETIVDFDQSGTFNKRRIERNWAKYEVPLSECEFDLELEENNKVYDYNFLVENASSDFSHFQFASEKSWEESKPIVNNPIFKLDLNILSNGLACVPFYERIDLDEEKISDEDKKRCDEEAKRNWEKYQTIKENSNKNSLEKNKIKKNDREEKNLELYNSVLNLDLKENILDFTFFPEENLETSEVDKSTTKVEFTQKSEKNIDDWFDKALLLSEDKKEQNKLIENENIEKQDFKNEIQPQSQKVIFRDKEENLEDWLDSVLDD